MNSAQQNYTTTEKELLSIVETLKEFRNILSGHHIMVYTNNKNLTCKFLNTERVIRWHLILEEFVPELKYIKEENNGVADALSLLEKSSNQEILNIYELYGYDDKDLPDSAYPIRYHDRYPSTARGSSLAVNDRTLDVRVTSDRPSTPGGLLVHGRVPVGIKQDQTVASYQVQTVVIVPQEAGRRMRSTKREGESGSR